MHLGREFAAGARIAYDTVDLHFLREERRGQHDKGANPKLAEAYRKLELALARAADATVAVSNDERAQLLELAPELSVEVVPMANDIAEDVPGPDARSGLLSWAASAPAEHRSAVYLATDVMPRLWRTHPDVELTIVGSQRPRRSRRSSRRDQGRAAGCRTSSHCCAKASSWWRRCYRRRHEGQDHPESRGGLPVVTTTIGAEAWTSSTATRC